MKGLPAATVVFCLCAVSLGGLPQNYAYQVELRNYLGTLTEADFALTLEQLTYDPSYLATSSDVHSTWLILDDRGRDLPSMTGLRVGPENFLLSSIERSGQVYMSTQFFDPASAAWWSQWDYAGNPYYNSSAVKRRAFVNAAVDLMMQDRDHDLGSNKRSDYLGANLIWYGYAYQAIKDDLPTNVRSAYETGMVKMFQKVETWGPTGIFGDMDSFAIVGMNYVADSIGDPDLKTRAQAYTQRVFDKHFKDGGYMGHGDGFDPSYMGIDFNFLTWAALFADDPAINNVVAECNKLKAYLTLPDGEKNYPHYWGPTHFATATAADSANDQWNNYSRDAAAAMISDDAKYLMWRGRVRPANTHHDVLQDWQMRNYITAYIDSFDTSASTATSPVWSSRHWVGWMGLQGPTYYQEGFHQSLLDIQVTNPELKRPPFERDDARFIENFGDKFLCAKFGSYGAIIHTGRLSWWGGSTTSLSGFSGGALSAFWTKDTGPVLLGRTAGYQGPAPDGWHNWREWPTHAISGVAAGGRPFSSARQRYPESSYVVNETDATVDVWGPLTGTYPAPNNALTGAVDYHRTFTVTERGLTVVSSITSDQSNYVTELWEILPVFLYDTSQGVIPVTIELLAGDEWLAAGTGLTADVEAVRVDRFYGSIYIMFDTPQDVKLSPNVWSTDYQSHTRCRNIMIDLLHSGGASVPLPSVSIEYLIASSMFVLGDMDGSGAVNNNDITPFVLALTDRPTYEATYPGIDPDVVGDIDGSGALNNNDITPFVTLLTTGSYPQAAPEPATMALLAAGGLALLRRRSR